MVVCFALFVFWVAGFGVGGCLLRLYLLVVIRGGLVWGVVWLFVFITFAWGLSYARFVFVC